MRSNSERRKAKNPVKKQEVGVKKKKDQFRKSIPFVHWPSSTIPPKYCSAIVRAFIDNNNISQQQQQHSRDDVDDEEEEEDPQTYLSSFCRSSIIFKLIS